MTARVLGSVCSLSEARLLLSSEVDIVDLKDPNNGALGALPLRLARRIASVVAGRRLSSATIGDIAADADSLNERILETAALGVDYVKVGLFSASPPDSFLAALRAAASSSISVVVVLFAEHHRNVRGLESLLDSGIRGIMLDTCNKSGATLLDLMGAEDLREFLQMCRRAGLLAGFAGSLGVRDLGVPVLRQADYLGFRGALCRAGERGARIDARRVRAVCAKVKGGQGPRRRGRGLAPRRGWRDGRSSVVGCIRIRHESCFKDTCEGRYHHGGRCFSAVCHAQRTQANCRGRRDCAEEQGAEQVTQLMGWQFPSCLRGRSD